VKEIKSEKLKMYRKLYILFLGVDIPKFVQLQQKNRFFFDKGKVEKQKK